MLMARDCHARTTAAGAICLLLGPNYRMTELQAAVGLAQLGKIETIMNRRRVSAQRLRENIATIDGLVPPPVPPEVA